MPLDSATEQAEAFVPIASQNRNTDMAKNAQMKTYLKGHHFELGSKNQKVSTGVNGPYSVLTGGGKGNHYLNQYSESQKESGKLQRE